jgi:hypothetical protein
MIPLLLLVTVGCGDKQGGDEDADADVTTDTADAGDAAEADAGDGEELPPATLVVTSPVRDEVWRGGEERRIEWTSTNVSEVDIAFSGDDGGSWNDIVLTEPDTSSYAWTVPGTVDSGLCRIRVLDTDGRAGDTSDLFSIRPAEEVGEWSVSVIGSIPHSTAENGMEIAVGDGRNDGMPRVYVASWEGGLYEWSWDGVSWTMSTVLDGADTLVPVDVGDARGNGTSVVLTGTYVGSDEVLGLEHTGTWASESLSSALRNVVCVRVADGRGDGTLRVYAGGESSGGLREYTWNGASWDELVVDADVSSGTFAVGVGRNDGVTRIYLPDRSVGGGLREYTWNGATWDGEVIPVTPGRLVLAVLGDGRNDGTLRIYINGFLSHLYELTWNGAAWDELDVMPGGRELSRFSAAVAQARGDGVYRIYASTQGHAPVTEFTWTGGSYSSSEVDMVTGASAGALTVGDGRNDDTQRIYVSDNHTGEVYELTWTTP